MPASVTESCGPSGRGEAAGSARYAPSSGREGDRTFMENIAEVEEAAASIPRGGHRNGAAGAKGVTLGPRDVLNGSLTIEGDLHIEGTAEGEITASGDVDVEASAT